MKIELTPQTLEIRLSGWERALGLMGSISLPRSAISDVRLLENGIAAVELWAPKAGLRVPGLIYVARSLSGPDRRYIVRRHEPALEIDLDAERGPKQVLVSTPEAPQLARELSAGLRPA